MNKTNSSWLTSSGITTLRNSGISINIDILEKAYEKFDS